MWPFPTLKYKNDAKTAIFTKIIYKQKNQGCSINKFFLVLNKRKSEMKYSKYNRNTSLF